MGTMESDQFFLKWNNFESNLASGFADLLQQEAMVDVTLAVEGRIVQAHKIILSICSSYFRNMFQLNPCQHPIVVLKDVGYQELIDMLDFMYKGEANVRQQDLPSFLKLAETLKIKGLAGNPPEKEENTNKNSISSQISSVNMNDSGSDKTELSGGGLDDISSRKKRKRPVSPYKNLGFISTNSSQNIKLEIDDCQSSLEASEITDNQNNFNKEDQNTAMNEERLEFRDRLEFFENNPSKYEIDAGPSSLEESYETTHQDFWNTRKTSKPLSIIWSFFNYDCLENKSECKLCGKVFKASPKTGTASVKYHLHFAHQILRNDSGSQ